MKNKFSALVHRVNKLPTSIRCWLLTTFFNRKVKFAGTAGLKLDLITQQRVEATLSNRKKVQNHIGGVHAVAAALIAESASGIVFGMNVPDSHLPLLKSMKLNYNKRMQGGLSAVALISNEQQHMLLTEDKGSMFIAVEISDESGQQPIVCEMEWAWTAKKRN